MFDLRLYGSLMCLILDYTDCLCVISSFNLEVCTVVKLSSDNILNYHLPQNRV